MDSPTTARRPPRSRMTGPQRREQLLDVGRSLFAEKGYDATSVEEVAARAQVSKPVVYEHFGGKEGLYAVIVDREIRALLAAISGALSAGGGSRLLVERAALALLGYIESSTDGFRILVRDSPVAQSTGTFSSLISDVASQVEHLLAAEFNRRNLATANAPMYAQMLVGMVAL
ncbi:MAG: TetR/AcrR family transcriptional regulator, partial [Angustibacter sp.]